MYFIGVRHFSNEIACMLFNLLFLILLIMEAGILVKTGWRSFTSEKNKKINDGGSYLVVVLGNWIGIIVSMLMLGKDLWPLPAGVAELGIGLMAFGLIFRLYAFWVLRKFFTVTVTATGKQVLIQKGPYRYIRHPAYLGSICIVLGIALALRTGIAFLIGGLLMFICYHYRITVEERVLEERFKAAYSEYRKRTGSILPRVFF